MKEKLIKKASEKLRVVNVLRAEKQTLVELKKKASKHENNVIMTVDIDGDTKMIAHEYGYAPKFMRVVSAAIRDVDKELKTKEQELEKL